MKRGVNIIQLQAELQAEAAKEAEQNWVDAAEAALANNRSTVAVLPIHLAMNQWVYLGKLRAKGYSVEDPR